MKSIIRGVFLFAAGAGCAAVLARGDIVPRLTPDEFKAKVQKLVADTSELGVYVVDSKDGVLYVNLNPGECVPTPDPQVRDGAYDPRWVRDGADAVREFNYGLIAGQEPLVVPIDTCKPATKR
jgi:hypothetical protein